MSRLPSRGRLKAVAADFCQLINSPSTRMDNSVLLSCNSYPKLQSLAVMACLKNMAMPFHGPCIRCQRNLWGRTPGRPPSKPHSKPTAHTTIP